MVLNDCNIWSVHWRYFWCYFSWLQECKYHLELVIFANCYAYYTDCIGVNRPAFGGTVPHFHQMSRVPRETDIPHFFKNGIIIFCIADYFTFLPWNATKWRSSVHTSHADRRRLYFTRGSHHRWLFILLCRRQHQHCYQSYDTTVTCHGWWILIG